ncbi:hypothetical protein CBF60_02045 [Lactobacillus taiwanensis]|uniref:hypothetical protein n=1 Tax=Lactobacillus taiwanensis TaxID=508451 RepID=UPI000B99705F|nr:hypothetical protein [Lactobacillus taiwanensis]OYS20909.1 hypothetical protein CBF76_04760 [Lactobacillus taiwanensis]OYS24963.1 hypothetical protein CBF55_03745 [Lactobacillus taiwanensis]OYS26465.1 hypothetical protein CBF66_00660 [Lactobacillus taiwanensis]OYS26758.1 hypothetical protein CBF73_01740 [Lactobacillus taiwanensis]OYS29847.1 hypothetical protein CBF60_02045 [Lactobacillus taiwanensis]
MKNVVYNEVVYDRRIMVQKHDNPFEYYTGYIQLHFTDPRTWLDKVRTGDYDYFDELDEFSEIDVGINYAGNLGIDSELWVGFDTASFPIGEYTEEDCVDMLERTARLLFIRTNAVSDAMAEHLAKDQDAKTDERTKHVGLLLETLNDLANASAFNELGKKNKVREKIDSAGKKLTLFLTKDMNVSLSDIALFTILKTVLSEDDEDQENE